MTLNNHINIPDHGVRTEALDISRSFIVQAPAGSGKTGLLILRFLKLLSVVSRPEEILAITFTRKAASEMKTRITGAMRDAQGPPPQGPDHARQTWELARLALKQDQRYGWGLLENPNRLQVMTIDAFCAYLARRSPLGSGMGMRAEIIENPWPCYREAAQRTINRIEEKDDGISGSVAFFCKHMDNRIDRVERLIARMLARRDQWLRFIGIRKDPGLWRNRLESFLKILVARSLEAARESIPSQLEGRILEAARHAARNLPPEYKTGGEKESPIAHLEGIEEMPGVSEDDLKAWLGIAELLLTRNGTTRKSVNRNIGFPPPSSGRSPEEKRLFEYRKKDFQDLLKRVDDLPGAIPLLHYIRCLPLPAYSDEQWSLIATLLEVLLVAAAELRLVFAREGGTDFAEVAMAAQRALGSADDPTDLGLMLDYRISHILADEFQDTSISQFELFSRLTAGWTPGDGRTFFAVGDPMQSIYGFREAEVGLFALAREAGISDNLPLVPLVLSANFRSDPAVIEFANSFFPLIMPEKDDPARGGVAYARFEPVLPHEADSFVRIVPLVDADEAAEAGAVFDCIREARALDSDQSIAILVRARSHLPPVLGLLKQAGLDCMAVEIDPLSERPCVMDLAALARAISSPCDRAAWLSVMRAPWCGLSLSDLHLLASDRSRTIFSAITDNDILASLSADGRARAGRVGRIISTAVNCLGRLPFLRVINEAWTALGGPIAYDYPEAASEAGAFFDFLESNYPEKPIHDPEEFQDALALLRAQGRPEKEAGIQVMTMHKAKGLEFDTVILCGVHKTPPPGSRPMFRWQEVFGGSQPGLLLGALPAAFDKKGDSIYDYIAWIQKQKGEYEKGRLLYVAVTRARRRLYIVANAQTNTRTGEPAAPPGSLLSLLWPVVCDKFANLESSDPGKTGKKEREPCMPVLRRIPALWQPSGLPPGVKPPETGMNAEAVTLNPEPGPVFDWAGETIRRIGIVVHRRLAALCNMDLQVHDAGIIDSQIGSIRSELESVGIEPGRIAEALGMVVTALKKTLEDPVGQWIVSARKCSATEFPVSGFLENRLYDGVIDRTFVDEQGIRWVIDFKSSIHEGSDLERFLDQEVLRYRRQLSVYARLMRMIDPRPVKTGLYFPMHSAWRECDLFD